MSHPIKPTSVSNVPASQPTTPPNIQQGALVNPFADKEKSTSPGERPGLRLRLARLLSGKHHQKNPAPCQPNSQKPDIQNGALVNPFAKRDPKSGCGL